LTVNSQDFAVSFATL